MSTAPTSPVTSLVSRRNLLRSAGLVAASGAVLAACGDPVNEAPTRLGEAPTTTALPDVKVDDVVLLRTAMSMEALVHLALTSDAVTTTSSAAVMAAFARRHEANLATLSALVTARGGKPFTDPNPKLATVYGNAAIELVADSDRADDDAKSLAHAMESLLAATYQNFVTSTLEPALRADMMRLGASASRRSAVLAQLIRGGAAAFAPAVDADGAALVSTLPSAFGPLTAVQVALGKKNETGARTVVVMDTPSLNSYVY